MRKLALAAVAALAFVAAGCGVGPDKSREDAADTAHVDKAPPSVTAFNNQYPNVENKCDGHGHRIFVTTHNGKGVQPQLRVLPDPTCPGYARGQEPVIAVGP